MRLAYGTALAGALLVTGCFEESAPIDATSADGSGTSETMTSGPSTTASSTTDDPPATETSTTDPDPTGSVDDTTTGDPLPCTEQGLDPQCPADAPFCQDGACVDCTGLAAGACAAIDPSTPVCDADTGACAGCTEHAQCDSEACRFATGECFAPSNRLWVDNTAGGCAGGTGQQDNPVCNVVDAMGIVNSQPGMEPWAIFVAGSPTAYVGSVDPDNNRPVAVLGPTAGLTAVLDGGSTWTIDQWAQSPETYLDHLTIDRSSFGPAIRCNTGQVFVTDSNFVGGEAAADITGCSLRLRRSVVSTGGWGVIVSSSGGQLIADETSFENSSGGIYTEGTVVLRRSVVRDHFVDGGIEVAGGDLTLINSMVYYNQYVNDGIYVGPGGTAEIVHSTIIGALTCTMAGPTSVRNSIVLGSVGEAGMACSSTAVDDSVVNAGLGQGSGNVPASMADFGAIFVNPTAGLGADWHVLPGSLPQDVAVHLPADPVVDFDGDPRPTMAGAPDYAGADVP
ncbi:MAG: right-handed parallel beta-helix repeat-containing protein [Nannocystaceae bacterium]